MQPLTGAAALSQSTPSYVIFGYFFIFLMALVGGMVGAYAGWMIDDGMYPVIGAAAGFAFASFFTWLCSGVASYQYHQFVTHANPPEFGRLRTTGLSSFSLYVMVHRVQNVYHADFFSGLLGLKSNPYIEVKVGRQQDGDAQKFSMQMNKVKRTCIQGSAVFEECFNFTVAPTDDTIRFNMFDQDMFSDESVGYVDVNITEDVLNMGFPQHKAFKLVRYDDVGDDGSKAKMDPNSITGILIVSFMPGAGFPESAAKSIEAKQGLAYERMESIREKLIDQAAGANYGAYGSWATKKTMV